MCVRKLNIMKVTGEYNNNNHLVRPQLHGSSNVLFIRLNIAYIELLKNVRFELSTQLTNIRWTFLKNYFLQINI